MPPSTEPGEQHACIISDRRARVRRLTSLRSARPPALTGGRGMTGRPSAEELCRRVIETLDENLRDAETVRKLRTLFDIPDPYPRPLAELDDRQWPVLRAADPPNLRGN